MVHGARWVALHSQRMGGSSPLFAFEDVEVVVGGMTASVAFCAEWRAEDDEIFGQRRVQDIHASHGAAGVVEEPAVRERRGAI